MRDKLRSLEERFEGLVVELADPALMANRERYQARAKAWAEIEPVVLAWRRQRRVEEKLASARETLAAAGGDAELAALARDEVAALAAEAATGEDELRVLLVPKDPNDGRNAILEVRAGTGGDEASLFAAELLRAYLRYAESRGWKASVLHRSDSSAGGVKEAVVEVEGAGAYSRLKHESGVHRVQRVPETEASGRIHTSAASVAVLPEVEDVEVEIAEKDLRVDLFCSSGAGGQSVNTTYSAVRITHLPTGLVVQCQDERSQQKNRTSAMKVLRARLHEAQLAARNEAIAAERRGMVGTGDRSEKIRTYNFPQGRVTDHRVPITVHRVHEFMQGDMDVVLDPLIAHLEAERLQEELKASS